MFIIIGGDKKEYGPVTVGQVRAWIAAGRANLDTQAKAIGSEEWRRLGDYAEFNAAIESPPPLPGPDRGARLEIDPRELASRVTRTGAALLNAFVYFLCIMPGAAQLIRQLNERYPELAQGKMPRIDELDLTIFTQGVLWVWAGLLSAMLVQTILIAVRGQNLGKLMLGGRVVRVSDGQPAGFVRGALVRFILPVMIVMFLNILFPLGLLFLAIDYGFIFREDQRCLHDLIAGTKVVRT